MPAMWLQAITAGPVRGTCSAPYTRMRKNHTNGRSRSSFQKRQKRSGVMTR